MARRHRTRSRTRRDAVAERRTPAPAPARAEREAAPPARTTHRPARVARGGYARAAGEPSPALERAAVAERAFVSKDFRRVGIVVAICAALLVVSGIVENLLLH